EKQQLSNCNPYRTKSLEVQCPTHQMVNHSYLICQI
ncbi:hypothetical protein SOVF_175000, partial [Spinacia oleracea]